MLCNIEIYTVYRKRCHSAFASNVAKCKPIFKILLRTYFAVNLLHILDSSHMMLDPFNNFTAFSKRGLWWRS